MNLAICAHIKTRAMGSYILRPRSTLGMVLHSVMYFVPPMCYGCLRPQMSCVGNASRQTADLSAYMDSVHPQVHLK